MKAKEIVMVIALSVLTSLFFGLLVDALYEAPNYEDFCSQEFVPRAAVPIGTKECVFQPLRSEEPEINKCYKDKGQPEFNYDEKGCQQGFKSCNFCNKEFDEARAMYNRNVFYIIAPIGLVLLVLGLFLGYEVVGTGLMFSGILLIGYATIRYFSDMSKLFRAFVIFIELVLLIIISIKKLKK